MKVLWNQKADDLESWYAASGTQVLICSNNDPGLTLIFLWQGQIWSLMLLYGEKGTISETIVVYDIKVGRFSLLNEYMNRYEYQRSRSFIDLRPRSLRFNIFSLPESKAHW